jgi:hypothetical protein
MSSLDPVQAHMSATVGAMSHCLGRGVHSVSLTSGQARCMLTLNIWPFSTARTVVPGTAVCQRDTTPCCGFGRSTAVLPIPGGAVRWLQNHHSPDQRRTGYALNLLCCHKIKPNIDLHLAPAVAGPGRSGAMSQSADRSRVAAGTTPCCSGHGACRLSGVRQKPSVTNRVYRFQGADGGTGC